MHHDDWLGFSGDGKTAGSGEGFAAWRLMRERSVRLEETPPYLLKAVDAEIIRKIEIRQKTSWTRLPAAFPGGERRQVLFSGILFFINGYNSCQRMESCNARTYRVNPSPPQPGMSLHVFLCLSFSGSYVVLFLLHPLPSQN